MQSYDFDHGANKVKRLYRSRSTLPFCGDVEEQQDHTHTARRKFTSARVEGNQRGMKGPERPSRAFADIPNDTLLQGWDIQDLQSAGHGAYSPGEVFLGGGTLKIFEANGGSNQTPAKRKYRVDAYRMDSRKQNTDVRANGLHGLVQYAHAGSNWSDEKLQHFRSKSSGDDINVTSSRISSFVRRQKRSRRLRRLKDTAWQKQRRLLHRGGSSPDMSVTNKTVRNRTSIGHSVALSFVEHSKPRERHGVQTQDERCPPGPRWGRDSTDPLRLSSRDGKQFGYRTDVSSVSRETEQRATKVGDGLPADVCKKISATDFGDLPCALHALGSAQHRFHGSQISCLPFPYFVANSVLANRVNSDAREPRRVLPYDHVGAVISPLRSTALNCSRLNDVVEKATAKPNVTSVHFKHLSTLMTGRRHKEGHDCARRSTEDFSRSLHKEPRHAAIASDNDNCCNLDRIRDHCTGQEGIESKSVLGGSASGGTVNQDALVSAIADRRACERTSRERVSDENVESDGDRDQRQKRGSHVAVQYIHWG